MMATTAGIDRAEKARRDLTAGDSVGVARFHSGAAQCAALIAPYVLHPYTQALLASTPGLGRQSSHGAPKGELPSPLAPRRVAYSRPASPMRSSGAATSAPARD